MGKTILQDSFFAMVFSCTTDTIETEKVMQKQFKTMIIPTPREISESCGFAIRCSNAREEELMEFVKCLDVPHALYLLSAKEESGARAARLIKKTV